MDFIKTSSPRALNWSSRLLRETGTAGRGTSVPWSANIRTFVRPAKSTAGPTYRSRTHRPAVSQTRITRPKLRTTVQRLVAARHNSRTAADRTVRPGRPRPMSGPKTFGESIHPAEPDERTRKLSATIDTTVPIADYDSTAGRTSRPTVRTVRSTRSRF
ncbi:unnamed protein product [Microthlaspi erraticum]|uniref:Uncharacterized protein n=1 Tax=Microthlaspi erraticum TaxID=1685480 RepID=A0A6D2KNA1_9BRAS|nr:unnamed protein product [Microthlaspi erraticum]